MTSERSTGVQTGEPCALVSLCICLGEIPGLVHMIPGHSVFMIGSNCISRPAVLQGAQTAPPPGSAGPGLRTSAGVAGCEMSVF